MEGTHEGHRSRLREQYLNGGCAALGDVGVLELMLTYAIPRRDVRPIAEKLLARFGTLDALFGADVETIAATGLVSKNAAVFIHLTGERAYRRAAPSGCFCVADDAAAAQIFAQVFKDASAELVYVLCLGHDRCLLYRGVVFRGDINSVKFRIRDITEPAVYCDSPYVYIAHNHISGAGYPSAFDVDTTRRIADSLASNEITLCEHFVFRGETYKGVYEMIRKKEGGSE